MKILCPSYFYPGPIWDTLIKSNSEVSAIINPNSGVGDSFNEDYFKLCVGLRKARVGISGYISTKYGKRLLAEVEEEIIRYAAWYGVNDIFVDEASSELLLIRYYTRLYERIRGIAILNHGTIPDEAYLQCGDILVIFESTYAKHALVKFPQWLKRHPKNRFCQIVHSCPDWPRAKRALAKASETSEFVYVTDDTEVPDDNPYDVLPTYWNKELKACR